MFIQSNGLWLVINDCEGNIEKAININYVKSIKKNFEKIFKGEREDGSWDIEDTDHEMTELTFADGSVEYVDLPISKIVEMFGLMEV